MKKIIINLGFLVGMISNIATIYSEKNWLQAKMDTFVNKLVTRYTYDYNSFEHKRDKALLYVLPADISQNVLRQQRLNMVHFLQQNEEVAQNEIRKYWNFDQKTWEKLQAKTKKQTEFNRDQMKKEESCSAAHNPDLAPLWQTSTYKQSKKRQINPHNLVLDITYDNEEFASTEVNPPLKQSDQETYNPVTIRVNQSINELLNESSDVDNPVVNYLIAHELTHALQGHGLLNKNITSLLFKPVKKELAKAADDHNSLISFIAVLNGKDIYQTEARLQLIRDTIELLTSKMEHFEQSPAKHKLTAAQEKTADTFPCCIDAEYATNAMNYIERLGHVDVGYPDNHNDMKVIHENWQTSQTITNFQQLKNSIVQK